MAIRAFRVRITGCRAPQDLLVGVRGEWMMSMSEFVRIQNALFATFKRKGKIKIDFLGCFQETMVWKEEDLLRGLDWTGRNKRKPRRKKTPKKAVRTDFGGTPCLCSEEL
jgi:hypothetical protein